MSDRKLLRVYCSKAKSAHEVASVVATAEGMQVDYIAPIDTRDGTEFHRTRWRPTGSGSESTDAWCPSCRMRLPLMFSQLLTAAKNGDRVLKLHAEGMWRDPLGVLRRRREREG